MNTPEDPSISNDVRPLPPSETLQRGLGLGGMRQRAERLAARWAPHSGPVGGAVVGVTLAASTAPEPLASSA